MKSSCSCNDIPQERFANFYIFAKNPKLAFYFPQNSSGNIFTINLTKCKNLSSGYFYKVKAKMDNSRHLLENN